MKTTIISLFFCAALLLCIMAYKPHPAKPTVLPKTDSVIFSFTFVGCNRVERQDRYNSEATNASTANISALNRIYTEMTLMKRKPELFFFLGDMVLGESNTQNLDRQLKAWVQYFNNTGVSKISKSKIELVAMPGNHEMLYYKDYGVPNHDEWPLKGATDICMKYFKAYLPKDRVCITGPDSMANRMTFSFRRKNVAFVVMNTDTYNEPTATNPYGLEGQIPLQWINSQLKTYKSDTSIKHIFVLGHKPYYISNVPDTGHEGLPQGAALWSAMQQNNVTAMLSAHYHDYQRMQPDGKGTYQIIAGNGGSLGPASFFGYSQVNIWSNGTIELRSKGFNVGMPYYQNVPQNPFTLRDSTLLTATPNANPYNNW